MRTSLVQQDHQRVDALVKRVSQAADGASLKLQADLTYYLCIVTSGFIERSIKSILQEYAKKRARPFVVSYVETQLDLFRNPDLEKVLILLGSFNPAWRKHVESSCKREIQIAINSIVGSRNRIAHGESVSLNLGSMMGYYASAVKFIELVDQVVWDNGERESNE